MKHICGVLLALLLIAVAGARVPLAQGAAPSETLTSCAAKGDVGCVLAFLDGPEETDVDEKDETGKTALCYAAKVGSRDMVNLLLMVANPRVACAGKQTPLHIATKAKHTEIVRLLLAYGAKADALDDSGLSPRKIAAIEGNAGLNALFDMEAHGGAQAFEDLPGAWRMYESEEHSEFFFHNVETGETRWSRPPECSWVVHRLENGHKVYWNKITEQTVYTIPRALAWKHVRDKSSGEWYWWNFKTERSQADAPAELPDEIRRDPTMIRGLYWNTVTGETQWEDPRENHWNLLYDEYGNKFWFRPATGETAGELPAEAAWTEAHSDDHNRKYYYNAVTQEKQWEKPSTLAWEVVDEDVHDV
eukprot:jgi/Mesvir1/24747/Mv22009-RA.1